MKRKISSQKRKWYLAVELLDGTFFAEKTDKLYMIMYAFLLELE